MIMKQLGMSSKVCCGLFVVQQIKLVLDVGHFLADVSMWASNFISSTGPIMSSL